MYQKEWNFEMTPENLLIDGKKIDGTILNIHMTYAAPNKENPEDHLARRLSVAYTTKTGEFRQFTVGLESVTIGRETPHN